MKEITTQDIAHVIKLSSLKVYPNEQYNKDTEETKVLTLDDNVTVILQYGSEEHTFNNCKVDLYTPVVGYGYVDLDKAKAEHGNSIYDVKIER